MRTDDQSPGAEQGAGDGGEEGLVGAGAGGVAGSAVVPSTALH